MKHLCEEIAAYARACERLLSKEGLLTEDERSLLEYYVHELSREFLSDGPTVRVRTTSPSEIAAPNPPPRM